MSGDGMPDLGFFNRPDTYFVIEVPDGETLHVELDSALERKFQRPADPAADPTPEREPGLYVRFKCVSDRRGHAYFFDRSVIGESGKPKEHTWVVEYTGHDGKTRQSRFRGALYGYRKRELPGNKWAFLGRIKVPLPY